MGKLIVDGSGVVKGQTDAHFSDESMKSIGPANTDQIIAAVVMYFRDEINTIRTLGLLAQSSRSVDDVINGIKAKLT